MTVQKFITYTPLNINGQKLDFTCNLQLNVLEKSGNYLLHKDLLRHLSSQKQGTVSTKTRSEVRGGGRKPWRQKGTGALQTLLYNKKNNILILENLENEINEPKTKIFLKVCQNCAINLDQKVLIIVSNKSVPLKLATKNLKNVELISASNLNTFSLLKAKQIILTSTAMNDIKEIYCD